MSNTDNNNLHDDPRLTAYALGELDLEEARQVRAAIAGDAAAQRYVEEVRAMAGVLRDELQAEPAASGIMNDQQRSAIREAALNPGRSRRLVFGVSFALAAMVMLAAGMTLVLITSQPAARTAPDEMYALYEPESGEVADHRGRRGAVTEVSRRESGMAAQSTPAEAAAPISGSGVASEELQQLSESKVKAPKDFVVVEGESLRSMDLGDRLGRDASQVTAERGLSEGRSNGEGQNLYFGDGHIVAGGAVTGKPADAKPDTEWSLPSQTELDRQLERRDEVLRRMGQRSVVTVPRAEPESAPGRARFERFYADESAAGGISGGAQFDVPGLQKQREQQQSALSPGAPARSEAGRPDLLAGEALLGPLPPPKSPDDLMLGLRVVPVEPNIEDPASREQYVPIVDNAFERATAEPLSTFSIDVDTASYANVRRFIRSEGVLPPRDAVRIEELLNYFTYDYAPPAGEHPFTAHVEVATAPWDASHKLVRIGIKGREMPAESRPPANLVFLLDVSGSMKPADKLPLLKQGMSMLAAQLRPEDRVAIVTYAGDSRVALNSTSGDQHDAIQAAIDQLQAGGSTNGGAGIAQAYQIAARHFVPGGVNRVVLATDGDFNVGTTSMIALQNLIEDKRDTGVFLSVLGFGTGNLKDGTMEMLADKGNGNYAYIDNLREARKVLVEQMNSTLVTIAKDVKVQVEFNPALVESYRLIGYENRVLAAEDFNDDRKDAGEIGAGHTVTALYEIVPATGMGKPAEQPAVAGVDPLRYRRANAEGAAAFADAAMSDELLTVKMRYKQPDSAQSTLLQFPAKNSMTPWEQASADFKFAAAVAGFGMILRDSPHKGGATWPMVLNLAAAGQGEDKAGWRGEFVDLVRTAKNIAEREQ